MKIIPAEKYILVNNSRYENLEVDFYNMTMIYANDFNVGELEEYYTIEFIFNDRKSIVWKFNNKEIRNINYKNIMDIIK